MGDVQGASPVAVGRVKASTYIIRRVLRDGTIHEREKERRKANPLPCGWCDRTDQVQRIQFLDWMGRTTAFHACPDHNAAAWQMIRAEQAPE